MANQYPNLKFFTGPTLVKEIAKKMRAAGLNVTCEGTEHVYVDSEGSDEHAARWNVLATLEQKHGTSFGLK